MKFQGQEPRQGSFGLPPQMKEHLENSAAEKENPREHREAPSATKAHPQPDIPANDLDKADDGQPKPPTPESILKKIGVTLSDDDLHNLLFRGFVEKEITLTKKPEFRAVFKTLTSTELDLVDEQVGEEIKTKNFTREGLDIRRNMWILSFSVQSINGSSLTKPKKKPNSDELDLVAMAKDRRDILGDLSPAVTTRMMNRYATFSTALNLYVEAPENDFLDEP